MVFDLEFNVSGGRTVNCQVHVRCFAAWEFEREQLDDQADLRLGDAAPTLQGSERDSSGSGHRE
jgi:hypothetical protein